MGAFGYGRRYSHTHVFFYYFHSEGPFCSRICPGRYVTLNSAWLAIVQILTVFTISPKRDKDGKAKLEPPAYISGLVV